ncbi:cation diffusion facilitator family transporter [Desulfovibrio ferrophilus]|uniref:Cation diffusion facilitator family transporter n=1 Tax=Desulfovibrio ferrophilus TaxID=241368 RepID=A0A2Z6AXT9_9BACT|nr:cation diffusion facilitator family transporter [Desulfovibrio ferrophilus]BBD08067.1 cation diffusion facilitator family transporter [Desulfovibrio ferrophilus]
MATSPTRYALYSIAASVTTLVLKFGAYFLTGSVGILSDATESLVNLAAAMLALVVLTHAMRPADDSHAYGHGKAEYFSSGVEGILIIVAAIGIVSASVGRFMDPVLPQRLGLGLGMALLASVVNFATAKAMLGAAKRFDSITLEADAKHLMTDVWTSVGLVVGLSVLMVAPASWAVLDPAIAVLMAVNIVFTGVSLIRRSFWGLMDMALPEAELKAVDMAIRTHAGPQAEYHALRTRKSGARRFIDFHLLVPGMASVAQSHALCCAIESEIHAHLPGTQVTIHVEPHEDAASHDGWVIGGACGAKLGHDNAPCAEQCNSGKSEAKESK